MRIATWNINSVRARIDRVVDFLERQNIDALALQEIKCKPAQFPTAPLEEAGYEVAAHGLNQWNGVAIISRIGLEDVRQEIPGLPQWGEPAVTEARLLSARVGGADGLTLTSMYVPNGREIDHPHYSYKLEWLAAVREHAAATLAADPQARAVLCGDFNVAPEDYDVWDMGFFAGKTHVTQPERDAFRAITETGFADLVRPLHPGEGVYTFWDYQQLRFPKRQGMKIDFLLGSPALQPLVSDAYVDRDERKGKGASDHAPVIVQFD
ncbi:exodeoxyribonuclease III [Dermabacteraceae bacterium P13138]